MAYRDDREANRLQIAELERENARLREELEHAQARNRTMLEDQHEDRARGVREACVACGGDLFPVAVFAGHSLSDPIPLNMSTLRFGAPTGGFTHAARVRSMACSSCGYIHNFIDMKRDTDG